jgi:phosphoglycolate phosphatase
VVTNKPGWLTEPLLDAFGLRQRAACVVSGDSLARRKPHPEPLLHACALCGVTAAESVYVGDAQRDVEAARAAGMRAVVALYGYLGEDEMPTSWKADHTIQHPSDLLTWLAAQEAKPAVTEGAGA